MSFEMNKFNVVKKKRLAKQEINVECNVSTESEIDKILSVCHTADAETAEVLNGVVNFAGTIDLSVVYSTIDGDIATVNCSCPFTSKFEDGDIAATDKIGIDLEVEDYSVESVNGNNIKINCQVVQKGVLIACREVGNVTTGDEDICLKEDEIVVNSFIGQNKEVFNVESEVSIKEPIKKLILSDSQVCVKNVESGVNFVSVSGEVVTRLLYLTEKDRFETIYTTETFKEEVELEGVTRESVSEAIATVKKNAVKCEYESDEKGVVVGLSIPVEVKVFAYEEKREIVIKDIYSTKCELAVSTESFDMTKQYSCDFFEAKIDGNLTLDDEKPRVDKIMFVGGSNLVVTNAYLKGGEVFAEGVAKTNVIYLNDETNSLHSVVIEVPFVVSDKANVECENAQVSISASIIDVDVVVKKGREFYFDAKLKLCASYDCEQLCAVISNIEEAGEYAERDCAIELVFAQAGQSAWDVAKTVRVREENILYQNPNIVFPLEQDENLIVYYQKR